MSHRTDPFREEGPVFGAKRRQIEDECAVLKDELSELDQQLHALALRRQEAARQLRQRRRRLWPNLGKRARAPLGDGRRALPPIARDAVGLWGRRLRASCRTLLRDAGRALSLTELHAMLHRQGYTIASRDPVKALADAMRYEVGEGRAERPSRGVYALR